jgi:hypothetical protein
MMYRGVEYLLMQGSAPGVWRWSVTVGKPEMFRLGYAKTERQAEAEVKAVIDRALGVQEALQSLKSKGAK